jgi:hypothetical protein
MDLNLIAKTVKVLEKNTGENLFVLGRENLNDTGFGNNFMDMIPKAQGAKEKIDKSVL